MVTEAVDVAKAAGEKGGAETAVEDQGLAAVVKAAAGQGLVEVAKAGEGQDWEAAERVAQAATVTEPSAVQPESRNTAGTDSVDSCRSFLCKDSWSSCRCRMQRSR